MVMLSRKHNSPVRCVVALLSASNLEFSETGGTASFYLLLHTVAQDTKWSEPSQKYYKRKGRPRQLVRLEIYVSKL